MYFATDQPSIQLLRPTLQLYHTGASVDLGHPRLVCLQHHAFLSTDHPFSQLASPAWQSYRSTVVEEFLGHPALTRLQHQADFSCDHDFPRSIQLDSVQLYGKEAVVVVLVVMLATSLAAAAQAAALTIMPLAACRGPSPGPTTAQVVPFPQFMERAARFQ